MMDWIGGICQDSNGVSLGARSVTKQVNADPKMEEVMAALLAMQFSKEVGFFYVIFLKVMLPRLSMKLIQCLLILHGLDTSLKIST
jgi:hypothetical protein